MARLFISQSRIDIWNTENRIAINGDKMTLVDDGRSFRIVPAVHFVKVAGGDPDPNDLVGKVRYESDLTGMGAELYMNDDDADHVHEVGISCDDLSMGEPVTYVATGPHEHAISLSADDLARIAAGDAVTISFTEGHSHTFVIAMPPGFC